MKLLKIEALNATVFKNPFEISFLTSQQVDYAEKSKMLKYAFLAT